ncbi:MAG: type II secretion system protein N [Candidatus Methylomirabilis sp.]
MGKPLRLLNLVLGLFAVLIAGALAKTWVAPTQSIPGPSASKALQESVAVTFSRAARPPLEQFDSLLEKNPFKQPPPAPVPRPGMTAPPPPRPLPTLSGTILVGDDWRAIVSDKGKAEIYAIGQEVGGGVITEIKEDRILLKRGDTTVDVLLKAAIEQGSPRPGPVQTPAEPASIPPPTLSAPAASGPRSPRVDQHEKQRQKQEKKAQKEERKLIRKQQKNK